MCVRCVYMYDYHIAVAFGHWLRLEGDGGHSINYIRQRTVSISHIDTRAKRKQEKERERVKRRGRNSEYLCS